MDSVEARAEEIVIRRLVADDYPALISLWNCSGITYPDLPDEKHLRAFVSRNPELSYVAEKNSTIIASVLCGFDGITGNVYHVAVRKEFRTQGLGRTLVERCIEELKAKQASVCRLLVGAQNSIGDIFWSSLGWVERKDMRPMGKILEI